MLARAEGANVRELCRRFGVSPKTGYKWLRRHDDEGRAGLADRSRRPHRSPKKTPSKIEHRILGLRDQHPAWGGRKLRARLLALGVNGVPSASTVTTILKRHGRLDLSESAKHTAWKRFEYGDPNALWQMDFKGHFPVPRGRCYPLTILDDHSRFAIGLRACADEKRRTVQQHLTDVFHRYGLPRRILTDNGNPWGGQRMSQYTALTVWLIRLGIRPLSSRPYHPQTMGKDERFHRTLKAEVLRDHSWGDLQQCQNAFDHWRDIYNLERPHQALDMDVPASRYHPSSRSFPSSLSTIEYGPGDIVRKVHHNGSICYANRVWRIGEAFRGLPVALRPTATDGLFELYFCVERISEIDLGHSAKN